MDSKVRQRMIAGVGLVLALVVGWQVAEGSFALAAVLAAGAILFAAHRLLGVAPDAWFTGLVLVGYLVGNRGFAQLHPPNTPLLPAEAALGLALVIGGWRWAADKRLPFRRDSANLLLLLWIVVAAIRVPFDFRTYGFMAVRDFAMTYYALFFFVAQDWARTFVDRRFLERCLTVGLALTTPVFWAFTLWPDVFDRLTVGGVPVIYIKSDVAGGFMAGGFFLFVERFCRRRRLGWAVLAAIALAGVATSDSRAAAVAVAAGLPLLVLLRRWRSLQLVGVLFALGVLALVGQAVTTSKPLAATPLYRAYESAASLADVSGTRTYRSAGLGDKPDNNQFRIAWWRTVIDDTWREGRWFGLGFGADLAQDFLRIYTAIGDEDFTARSPHDFPLSVFARTGLVGLAAFAAFLVAWTVRAWKSARRTDAAAEDNPVAWWLVAWSIFVSACFGVVLEGPMGAVVFWTALGLANAFSAKPADAEAEVSDQTSDVRTQKSEPSSTFHRS